MSSVISTFSNMFKQDKAEPLIDARRDFLKKFSAVMAVGGAVVTTSKTQTNQFTTELLEKISKELGRIKQLGQHQHEKIDQQMQRLDKRTQLLLRIALISLGVEAVGGLLELFSAGAEGADAIASGADITTKVTV